MTDNRVSRNKEVHFFDSGMKNRLREMLEEDEGEEPCVHFVPILDLEGNSYGIIGLDTLQKRINFLIFILIKFNPHAVGKYS